MSDSKEQPDSVDGSDSSHCSTDFEPRFCYQCAKHYLENSEGERIEIDGQGINRAEVMRKVYEILETDTANPADEIIKMGNTFQKIGHALRGLDTKGARAVIEATAIMHDVKIP